MFSDRHRTIKIIALAAVLFLFCLYSQLAYPVLTYQQCLSDPARYDGSLVQVALGARLLKISPYTITLRQPDGPRKILVPSGTSSLKGEVGDFCSAITYFHRDGTLELRNIDKDFRAAPLRRLKIIISIFPALFVMVWLCFSLQVERGRLVLQK